MSSPLRGAIDQLEKAGWTAKRGSKHVIWRCPCGRHQTLTPTVAAGRHGGAAIAAGPAAEIRRCLRDQKARGSAE